MDKQVQLTDAPPIDGTEREFPPLPEPAITSYQIDSTMCKTEIRTYSTKQMREYVLADRSAQAVSDGKKVPMTREEVELFAAQLVKQGSLTWAGFRQDEHGQYTIPVVNQSEYDLICALLAQGVTIQSWAADPESELEFTKRMFHAACTDLGLINEAIGLDPDCGGAKPILDAIEDLKAKAAQPEWAAPSAQQQSGWNAAIEAAAEAMGRQHVWITNTAAASVIRTLLRPAAQEAAREQPADEQTKRIQELEAQLDTMERLKDLSQEALQEMRAKFDAARREAFEQALDVVWKVTDHETATEISKKVCALQSEASAQPANERKDAARYRFLRSIGREQLNLMAHYAGSAMDAEIDRALAEKGSP